MVKVDVKGCCGFVDEAKYNAYVGKALDVFDVYLSFLFSFFRMTEMNKNTAKKDG